MTDREGVKRKNTLIFDGGCSKNLEVGVRAGRKSRRKGQACKRLRILSHIRSDKSRNTKNVGGLVVGEKEGC